MPIIKINAGKPLEPGKPLPPVGERAKSVQVRDGTGGLIASASDNTPKDLDKRQYAVGTSYSTPGASTVWVNTTFASGSQEWKLKTFGATGAAQLDIAGTALTFQSTQRSPTDKFYLPPGGYLIYQINGKQTIVYDKSAGVGGKGDFHGTKNFITLPFQTGTNATVFVMNANGKEHHRVVFSNLGLAGQKIVGSNEPKPAPKPAPKPIAGSSGTPAQAAQWRAASRFAAFAAYGGDRKGGISPLEGLLADAKWNSALDTKLVKGTPFFNALLDRPPHPQNHETFYYDAATKGQTLRQAVQFIIDFGKQKRAADFTRLNNLITDVKADCDARFNPVFISSLLDQIRRGAMDYLTQLNDALSRTGNNMGEITALYDKLKKTSEGYEPAFAPVDKGLDEAQTKIVSFVGSSASTMDNIRSDFKRIAKAQNAARDGAIISAVFGGLAALGSIGFGLSNFRAVAAQSAAAAGAGVSLQQTVWQNLKNLYTLPNGPALFGSGTLFANNTINTVNFSRVADGVSAKGNVYDYSGKPILDKNNLNRPLEILADPKLDAAVNDFYNSYGRFTMWLWDVTKRPGRTSTLVSSANNNRNDPEFPLGDLPVFRDGRVGYYRVQSRLEESDSGVFVYDYYYESWPDDLDATP